MTIRIEGLPAGFEGANAIRAMFALVGKLNPEKIKLNASIGVPGVPSRKTGKYPSVELPNYTQTPGGIEIQGAAVEYLKEEGVILPDSQASNAMVTPGKIGAFSHLVRSTMEINSGKTVYIDPSLPNAKDYERAVEMHGCVVVENFDEKNPPVIAAINDYKPSLDLPKLQNAKSTLVFADGVAKTAEAAVVSKQESLRDRMVVHRYVPSAEVDGQQLFPDLGILHTDVMLEREKFNQPLIQRLCAAQEHAQTCLPDVCVNDALKVLKADKVNFIKKEELAIGSDKARKMVAEEFNRYLSGGIGADKSNVALSIGGTGVLFNFVHALLPVGGKIGIFNPYFAAYNGPLAEGKVAVEKIGLSNGRPNLKEFADKVKGLDAVLINNPSNPLGIVFTKEELSKMIDILADCDAKVFLDDTYHGLVFGDDGKPCESNPFMKILQEKINEGGADGADVKKYEDLKQRCVVQISASKAIGGDPAKRCGMVYVPDFKNYAAMAEVQLNSVGSVPYHVDEYAKAVLEQRTADIASSGVDDWTNTAAATYGNRSNKAKEFASDVFELVSSPNGGFFAMVKLTDDFREKFYGKKIPENFQSSVLKEGETLPAGLAGKLIESDTDIATYLMLKAGVIMVPGSGFGFEKEEGVFRLSFSRIDKSVDIGQCLSAIREAAEILQEVPSLEVKPESSSRIAASALDKGLEK